MNTDHESTQFSARAAGEPVMDNADGLDAKLTSDRVIDGLVRDIAARHTPGKWNAVPPKRKGKHWSVWVDGVFGGEGPMRGAACQWHIASIANGAPGDTLKTEGANAHLISAAPELLAALRIARGYLADERARVVGAGTHPVGDESTLDKHDAAWVAEIDRDLATIDAALAKAGGAA